MLLTKSQTEYLDYRFSQHTWPLSRRGIGLNGLFHAEGSAVLLLGQQHTLIHSSSKIVDMAKGDVKKKTNKVIWKPFLSEEGLM